MGHLKKTDTYHHDTNVAKQVTFDIDLENGFSGGELFIDAFGYKTAAVQVIPQGTSGQSGQIDVKQSNVIGLAKEVSPTSIVPMSDQPTENYNLGGEITARYLILDVSNVTWSTQGKVRIIVIVKR